MGLPRPDVILGVLRLSKMLAMYCSFRIVPAGFVPRCVAMGACVAVELAAALAILVEDDGRGVD